MGLERDTLKSCPYIAPHKVTEKIFAVLVE